MSTTTLILSLLSSLCCCSGFVLIFLLIVGMMVLRKKGKKNVSAKEAIQAGAEVSRAFVRGKKTREELLAEEDEEEGR
ncbi:MAG: hypothetical protein ACOZNI_21815 [Myxococcota bacterium]